jgi:uncharacterized protein
MAVAVSGGVDSVTLSVVAHRALGGKAQMYHAVSPAVPADATARVERFARREGWALELFEAGEFADHRYLTNPGNRCYYCKGKLYAAIARRTDAVVVSGTNTDDLGDYRPGLSAAAEHGVRHPFVEGGINKQAIRDIARLLALSDLAELPASPCLSSRVETGIAIRPQTLACVDAAEKLIRHELAPRVVRCRVRRSGVFIELDRETLADLHPSAREALARRIGTIFHNGDSTPVVQFSRYRMGSAFLREQGQAGR